MGKKRGKNNEERSLGGSLRSQNNVNSRPSKVEKQFQRERKGFFVLHGHSLKKIPFYSPALL